MNRQERRQQQKELKKQYSEQKGVRHRVLDASVCSDILKYKKDFWDFLKYSTMNAIQNGTQHSLKTIKSLTHIEISSDMYESYLRSLYEHCNDNGTFNEREYFHFCIPPYNRGVLSILGQDKLWREWWVSNANETSYDLRLDTYIMSNDLYGFKPFAFVGINDSRILIEADNCSAFFIRTYSLYTHCYLDKNAHRVYDYIDNKCLTWDDFLDGMFQAEFSKYSKNNIPIQLKKIKQFAEKYAYNTEADMNADAELIINEFFDAIASFNYATNINVCKKTVNSSANIYTYEFNIGDNYKTYDTQRQLSLANENKGVIRIKSHDPNLLTPESNFVRRLNPIIWERRGIIGIIKAEK